MNITLAMKWILFTLLIALTNNAHLVFASVTSETIYLYPGYSVEAPLGQKSTLHATRKSIASITEVNGRTILTGRKIGVSTIRSNKKDLVIQVISKKNFNALDVLRHLISPLKGLKVEFSQGKVLLNGRLHRLKDWLEVFSLSESKSIEYHFSAKIDQDIQKEIKEHLTKALQGAGLPRPSIYFLNGKVKVSLPTLSENEKLNSDRVLAPYGLDAIYSNNLPNQLPLVEIQILVAEVRKNQFTRFGIQWPSAYSAKILPKWQPGSLEVTLNALEQNGVAQLLASPKLMTQSGSRSKFLAGGQIPIRTLGWSKEGVIWKNYGILLEAEPVVSWNGRMHIKLSTEVSTIDQSQTVNGIPGFRTNKISNEFNIESEQTIFLSGLIKNSTGESVEGFPVLSRIPILGRIFSSKDYQEQKSELVFMVTPRLVK